MEKIKHSEVRVNGINMHVAEIGEGPAVLLVHGFPELWYSWRHQMLHLSSRGYRAIAPDLRGYGDSDVPSSPNTYTLLHVIGDLVALLDALALPQEPGRMERFFAAIGAKNVMKLVLSSRDPNQVTISNKETIPTAEDLDGSLKLPSWLTEEDIDNYAAKFEKTGFTGGLNYYRCMDLSWELMGAWTGVKVTVPTRFIVGDLDMTNSFPGFKEYIHGEEGLKRDVPSLEKVIVMEGVAHFLNQEKPEEINELVYEFFKKF